MPFFAHSCLLFLPFFFHVCTQHSSNEDENVQWQAKLFCASLVFQETERIRGGSTSTILGQRRMIWFLFQITIHSLFTQHLSRTSRHSDYHTQSFCWQDLQSWPKTNLISECWRQLLGVIDPSSRLQSVCLPYLYPRLYFYPQHTHTHTLRHTLALLGPFNPNFHVSE